MTEETKKEFKPQCIWCNADWSDENIKVEVDYLSGGCDTCGYGATAEGSVTLTCHKCGKDMYTKDFSSRY